MARKSSVLNNIAMTNEEIAEKYGIEPIMKEMWVWDNPKIVEKHFVIGFIPKGCVGFLTIKDMSIVNFFNYASETNPNDKEIKVGDKGYFWDDESFYLFGKLHYIKFGRFIHLATDLTFQNFSHEKQPWMR
jgi:hypothetical protein